MMHERQLDGRLAVERLARWWTSASHEERFALLKRACDKRAPPETPRLEVLKLAIILAESEAGEVSEG